MTIGKDTWGGAAPSQARKDASSPPHWRPEMVAAVDRPHHLRVSPDGHTLAFILDQSDLGSDVWLVDAADGAPRQLTVDRPPAAFWEDTAPSWSPDGQEIAYTAGGWARVVATAGGPSRRLVMGWAPRWVDEGSLVVGYDIDRELTSTSLPTVTEVSRLALVEVDDPWLRPISSPVADSGDPDFAGGRMACTVYPPDDRNRSDVVVIDLENGEATTVAGTAEMHATGARWSPDGSRLAWLSEEPGWYALFVGVTAGDSRQLTPSDGDFSQLAWSGDGDRLAAVRTRRGRADLVVVDAESGAVEVLAAGGTWADPGWLADGSLAAVYEDHGTPARIEAIALDGSRRIVFDPAPLAVASAPHISPTDVTYRGSDGHQIHGFLFRPVTADRGPVPAIVYPHGGPTSVYGDEWDGYAQYFVDKGYAWFAINFRGSTSYGRDFERSNHGVWGVDDTGDCLAAADYLASLDWVDGDRLAIFGASYGSYLALTSLTDDPSHRFACGIAKSGDSDILTSWAQGDRVGVEDLERMMGHPSHARAAYRAGSPLHRLDQIAEPLLIVHGEQDERVDPRQSEQLVKELERLGKTYEYVTYPSEGHGLLRREPQLHFYRRLERFLDWYLM